MITRYIAVVLVVLACGAKFAAAAHCAISSTDVACGSFYGSTIRVTAILSVNCNPNANYSIGLDSGTAPGATVTARSMTGGSNVLQYGLFSDAAFTQNWGNTPGTGWVTGTGNGGSQLLYVYAQLPANQFTPVNTYIDTITATISGRNFDTEFTRFNVTAAVVSACSLSATDLAFGTYSGSLINAISTVSVQCTNATPYNVGLNAGSAAGATVTNRSMTGPGSALLNYKLLRNSARTVNWGNTVGTDTVAGTGTGGVQSLAVYGQLPANQKVLPGSYSDTITVTITY